MRVFLTGASAGIGLLAARALCERGHQVWGTARKAENLPVLENFHPIPMDLNDRNSIRLGFDQALGEAGRFDVLINNAGSGVFGPLEAFPDDALRAQMDVLFFGPLDLVRLALPSMRAANKGLIVNVSSLAAEFPLPFLAPYTVSKAALAALTEGLGMELAHTGVRVLDLRPGDFATSFHLSTKRVDSPLNAAYQPNLESAWKTIDKNMAAAPNPQRVADELVRIVEGRTRRPVVAIGDFFQARVAPLLARLVPRAWVQWGLRAYYGLKKA